jgi:L-seryl-tRNA(Ser) seleniumtransferase
VAYSGGKILRGPQGAGLLVGRRDLVRAAWANSAPHHGFGRALKVTKEEIVGMLRAVEAWHSEYDLKADFRAWESWYAQISDRITKVPGVRAEVNGPIRGGPFPTLNISWDPDRVGLTAGELGRLMLEGEPRIMTQAEGEGHSFLLRPVALKPGEHEIVAGRLYEVFSAAGKRESPRPPDPPSIDLTGAWDMEIRYEVGSARHKLFVTTEGNRIAGTHTGWAYQGDLQGEINGNRVKFRSALPADGHALTYSFTGVATADGISGEVRIGGYGSAKWSARRHRSA